ncbi:hypothetical protein B0H66DRAFT_104732 [Apodospora peruviana]|uniref:Uncharacterized protein n=1 Tax=Apodospora peruviana TaxID=516989 RepID=A0AAE0HRY3_9PEZI|nr:hypothetical protein B0H66DRAFT_104732 [Apodospora peruviana]
MSSGSTTMPFFLVAVDPAGLVVLREVSKACPSMFAGCWHRPTRRCWCPRDQASTSPLSSRLKGHHVDHTNRRRCIARGRVSSPGEAAPLCWAGGQLCTSPSHFRWADLRGTLGGSLSYQGCRSVVVLLKSTWALGLVDHVFKHAAFGLVAGGVHCFWSSCGASQSRYQTMSLNFLSSPHTGHVLLAEEDGECFWSRIAIGG